MIHVECDLTAWKALLCGALYPCPGEERLGAASRSAMVSSTLSGASGSPEPGEAPAALPEGQGLLVLCSS